MLNCVGLNPAFTSHKDAQSVSLIHAIPPPLLYTSPAGPYLNIKTVFPRSGDSHVKDKTVFNMGIPILVRRHLYIEMAPGFFQMPFQFCVDS